MATRRAQEMVRLGHSKRVGRGAIVASKLSDALSNRNSGKSVGIVLTKSASWDLRKPPQCELFEAISTTTFV
jgi:hypothetical protein